jgi:hypothetical protein
MITKFYILLSLFLCIALNGVTQEKFTTYEIVANEMDEAILDVKLYLNSSPTKIYRTNATGEYFIDVNKKVITEIIEHVGYESKTIKLDKKL